VLRKAGGVSSVVYSEIELSGTACMSRCSFTQPVRAPVDTLRIAQGAPHGVQPLLDRFLGVTDQRLMISPLVWSHSASLSRRRRHSPTPCRGTTSLWLHQECAMPFSTSEATRTNPAGRRGMP